MFSPRAGQAEWKAESITAAIAADPDVKSLNLTSKDSLSKFYKYVEAMRGAVQCGMAEVGDVAPDIPRALRGRSAKLIAIRERSQLSQPSDESIGVSKNSDLPSYSLASLGKSPTEHFDFMIYQRKISNYTGNKALAALDLSCTSRQTMDLIAPSLEEVRVGQMLKTANTKVGGGSGARRLGKLGELEGSCRQSNTTERIAALGRREEVENSMQLLAEMKKEVKQKGQKTKTETYEALKMLLGREPASGKLVFAAVELKKFIDSKLGAMYPMLGKKPKKTLAVIVPYLVKTSKYYSQSAKDSAVPGSALNDAAVRACNEQEQLLIKEAKAPRVIDDDDESDEEDGDDGYDEESEEDEEDSGDAESEEEEGDEDGGGAAGAGARGDGDGADGAHAGEDKGCDDHAGEDKGDNSFTLLRNATIAANHQMLVQLGLGPKVSAPASPPRNSVSKRKTTHSPIRCSSRLRLSKQTTSHSPPSPASREHPETTFDVTAIFGCELDQPAIWYFVKMAPGPSRAHKVFFIDHVDPASGECKLNCNDGFPLNTVAKVETRHVFNDVPFTRGPNFFSATLDIDGLAKVLVDFEKFQATS